MSRLTPEEFRRRLAGIADPDSSADPAGAAAEYRAVGVDCCLMMCALFGKDLDRMTLWDRIGSAFQSACEKAGDGNADRFLEILLEHIKADDGAVSRNALAEKLIATLSEKSIEWRQGFIRWVHQCRRPLLIHGRRAWEDEKRRKSAQHEMDSEPNLSLGSVL